MKKESKNILLGVGHCLRCDDGAGSFIAQHFHHHQWISLDGKSAPENFTSIIKKTKPQLLVIIDAAQLNLDAGQFRIIPLGKIASFQASTHSLPLHHLVEYLTPYCRKIIFIGIQPLCIQKGETMSPLLLKGCRKLIKLLQQNRIENILSLSDND